MPTDYGRSARYQRSTEAWKPLSFEIPFQSNFINHFTQDTHLSKEISSGMPCNEDHTIAYLLAIAKKCLSCSVTFFHNIPGSPILVRYIRSSYQDDPVRSLIELSLFLFAVYYLLAPTYNPRKLNTNFVSLTEREIDELVEDWNPVPLIENNSSTSEDSTSATSATTLLRLDHATGARAKLANGKAVLNLASYDHHMFSRDPKLIELATQVIRTYGVGPCSAPGFYGTFDLHMDLERTIASHFGTEGAIVYSQSFITIASVIPCFCKRGDIIIADKAVNYAIRKGIQSSRSVVRWYNHNDVEDLENVLAKVVSESRPLTRRFIITEAIFENTGDIIDLRKIISLKTKYKFRLLLDETWSYGVIGKTGRGITELQDVDVTLVDGIIGSLAGSLAAGGGFCTGSTAIVEHQRINSAAVTYSASLPTFLAASAAKAITILQTPTGEDKLDALKSSTTILRRQLQKSQYFRCCSALENPILHLVLEENYIPRQSYPFANLHLLLKEIVDECRLHAAVLITKTHPMPMLEGASAKDLAKEWQQQPSLKVLATSGISKGELEKAAKGITNAISVVMKRYK